MLASKSEKDSLGGTLFFNIAHYVLRPWPWIITALCSIIVYPDLAAIKSAFPNADAALIGHDSAFPAMLMFLPVGFVGLMIGGLIAANSSTILTHLNWGSSYLVHDFYRRFIKKDAIGGSLRERRPPLDCAPLRRRRVAQPHHDLGPAGLPGPALHRRRHRPALYRPLVLVARLRLVRSRRHGDVARDLGGRAVLHAARRLRDHDHHPGRPDHACRGSSPRMSVRRRIARR